MEVAFIGRCHQEIERDTAQRKESQKKREKEKAIKVDGDGGILETTSQVLETISGGKHATGNRQDSEQGFQLQTEGSNNRFSLSCKP
ncbi:hypothetical protein L1987_60582 [Smallanthus sonchifolius]|uniref:Uncharacterized protein n=1 Tax=Smallanthus sonchifolius TaxID=185202 RepID=A0ACB9D8E0_9ASTR|nr:hypothetical protein L1987_60582 [Smallanthus sonchifolius]